MSHTIKAVIFDLDGVLLESRDMHWRALNDALEVVSSDHVISHELHEKQFNGLPTKVKLNILTEQYGLDKSKHGQIEALKQVHTINWILNNVQSDEKLCEMFLGLKNLGIKTGIASNSVKATVMAFTHASGLTSSLVNTVLSNEDVSVPKPNGEIYVSTSRLNDVQRSEMLAIEDSHVGCASALSAGVSVLHVTDPTQLTSSTIKLAIEMVESTERSQLPVILMPRVKFTDSGIAGVVSSPVATEDCTYVTVVAAACDRLTFVEELNMMYRNNLSVMTTHNAFYSKFRNVK